MCGIAGIFAHDPRADRADRAELQRVCDHMSCRGPDGEGLWSDAAGRIALAHRRLAIIDLSPRGAQPMHSADGRYTIVFNGEIYNYRELRRTLEAGGRSFVSESDTEVLLHLYAERGAAMVHALRGMFALAIWDAEKGGLLLARDHFGIKPLYYADDGRTLRLASEVKALLGCPGVDASPEPAGHAGFFLWGAVPEPYTLHRGIRALPAGSMMWIDEAGVRPAEPFADVGQLLKNAEGSAGAAPTSAAELSEALRPLVLDSVRHHLVADVDVGVFLSAGIDSTTLLALATEAGGRLKTVTLGFGEYLGTPDDEAPIAAEVAKAYGSEHRTIRVTREDFRAELPRLLRRMDQPSMDGVNSYFVARAAREAGLTVALSGLGGDELFGGYPSFRQVPRMAGVLQGLPAAPLVGRAVRSLSAPLLGRMSSPKYAGLLEYGGDMGGAYVLRRSLFMPWELPSLIGREMAEEGLSELATRERLRATLGSIETNRLAVSALEATWYMRNQLLRDADWASMSHSLEVRVPLVDWTLWREAAPLLARAPLGKAAFAMTARPALDEAVLERPKTGFTTPVRDWLAAEQGTRAERGLRGWAQYLHARFTDR